MLLETRFEAMRRKSGTFPHKSNFVRFPSRRLGRKEEPVQGLQNRNLYPFGFFAWGAKLFQP